MRAICLSLPGLLLWTAAALAQGAPAQPPVTLNQKLDEVLGGWEGAMTQLKSFHAQCTRTILDKTYNSTETLEGYALFQKGDGPKAPSRACMELVSKKNKNFFEKYICTGTYLYDYKPADKVIKVYDMPQAKAGQVGDDNFLQFLFGMKAIEAKERYQMTFVPAPPEQAKHYHFVKIHPKLQLDKGDFDEARLVLMADTYLPRQLWYHSPNGKEITWDFPRIERNVQIPLQYFESPRQLPDGWKLQRAEARTPPPADMQPRIARPQNP
jgi:TIGR03009 family protein